MQNVPFNMSSARNRVFNRGISHPEFWLWDSWINVIGSDRLELFCLAVPRIDALGAAILPQHRNQHSFHVRKFVSSDDGDSWVDVGNILSPDEAHHKAYRGNVWSGSALQINTNETLHAFTGISEASPDHPFIQSLWFGTSSVIDENITPYAAPLLCPVRDYELIREKGYYLDAPDRLGHVDGETGGPIMAWRDPYVFLDEYGDIRCIWAAKTDSITPAIGYAKLQFFGSECVLQELCHPITLPDAQMYTQAEVPKIIWSEQNAHYYLLLSSCDRIREGQPDSEVSKEQRLYRSKSIEGPWKAYSGGDSVLPMPAHRFGCSIIDTNFEANTMRLITPVTEQAPLDPLTIASIIEVRVC